MHYRKVHHYNDEAMPPIHREKSLDEYCITSNASNPIKNKRNQIWNSTNNAKMARLSVPMDEDSSRTKRVSEGSSNSNCSSSSENYAESNNRLQSPPAPKNNLGYNSCSSSNGIKSNRLYSSNNSNSNFLSSHSNDSLAFSDSVVNKSINCMKAKAVINDMKMELQGTQHHEQHRDLYFQNSSKEIPMQQNYTNNHFPFPTTSNFQQTNLPSQF